MHERKLPPFFNYSQEDADSGYEAIQDFFLSWTIRCSEDKYKATSPKVSEYSQKIVYFLINSIVENNRINCSEYKEISIVDVKTYRQWAYVDLIAEITIKENGEEKLVVLSIENKWYSNIRDGQLSKSKKAVDEFYHLRYRDAKIEHIVIFADDSNLNDSVKETCVREGYRFLTVNDLSDYAKAHNKEKTENELFDAYWFMDDFA